MYVHSCLIQNNNYQYVPKPVLAIKIHTKAFDYHTFFDIQFILERDLIFENFSLDLMFNFHFIFLKYPFMKFNYLMSRLFLIFG